MSWLHPISNMNLQVVQLVQRMADQLQSNKLQVVFLINNYREVRKWNAQTVCVLIEMLKCFVPSDQMVDRVDIAVRHTPFCTFGDIVSRPNSFISCYGS